MVEAKRGGGELSKLTTADHLKLELMDECSCNQQQVVMFICKKQNCEDRGDSVLYCTLCAKTKHDHRSVMISNELQDAQVKWN